MKEGGCKKERMDGRMDGWMGGVIDDWTTWWEVKLGMDMLGNDWRWNRKKGGRIKRKNEWKEEVDNTCHIEIPTKFWTSTYYFYCNATLILTWHVMTCLIWLHLICWPLPLLLQLLLVLLPSQAAAQIKLFWRTIWDKKKWEGRRK